MRVVVGRERLDGGDLSDAVNGGGEVGEGCRHEVLSDGARVMGDVPARVVRVGCDKSESDEVGDLGFVGWGTS